jgi:hypothetical protein
VDQVSHECVRPAAFALLISPESLEPRMGIGGDETLSAVVAEVRL